MKKLLLPLILLCILPLSAAISQSLDGADGLQIGDSFWLNIYADTALQEVALPDSLKDFSLLSQSRDTEGDKQRLRLQIAVLNVGALSFPRLRLQPEDFQKEALYSDAFRLHILPVRAESDSLLRDIRPPRRYRTQLPFWLYLMVALVIIGLAIYLLIRILRRKKAPPLPPAKPLPPPAPHIPAWQTALKALAQLNASGILAKSNLEYHYRLSQILREYLKEAYHFNALEMTTLEIKSSLKQHPAARANEVLPILTDCDLVKFAKKQSLPQEAVNLAQAAEIYLKQQGEPSGI